MSEFKSKSKERIIELERLIQKGYYNMSLINSKNDILKPILYDNEKHLDKKFIQLAYRTKIPGWVFKDNTDNSIIASDYARVMTYAEKNYLIEQIKDTEKIKTVKTGEIFLKDVYDIITKLKFEPNAILIPIELFTKTYEFHGRKIEHVRGIEYLTLADRRIRILWSTKATPFNDIFFLDTSGIIWVQKKSENMEPFKSQPEYLKKINMGDSALQILAGIIPKEEDSVDFVMRLVVNVTVDKDKIGKIEIEKINSD